MNRRVFATAGLATIFLGTGEVAAYQRGSSVENIEFDSVDAALSFSTQNWLLLSNGVHEEGWEYANFDGGNSSLHIRIIPEDLVSPEEFPEKMTEDLDASDIVDRQDLEDGGWALALSELSPYNRIAYCEYQLGAFPGHNLQIRFWGRVDVFHNDFAKAQQIDLAGAPPFLFLDESGVEDVDVEAMGTTPSGAGSTTTRSTTRGNRQSATEPVTGVSNDDYVATVFGHREEFLDSYDLFLGHLRTLENLSDEDMMTALTIMVNIALTWQPYSDKAADLNVPRDLETLGAVFEDWAGRVSDMGYLFEEFYMGSGTAEAFVSATALWEQADVLLANELEKHLTHILGFAATPMVTLSDRVEAMARVLRGRGEGRFQRNRSMTFAGNGARPCKEIPARLLTRMDRNPRRLAANDTGESD